MSLVSSASSCAPRAPAAVQMSTVAAGSNGMPPRRPQAAPALGTNRLLLQRQREQVVVLLQQRSHWLALGQTTTNHDCEAGRFTRLHPRPWRGR